MVTRDNAPGLIDAFGRSRVSNPETIFDSKLLSSNKAPLLWDEALETGSGITSTTPTIQKPYMDIASTALTAGKFTRQSFRRLNYQPGKSQLILMTGVLRLSGGGVGVQRRIGYFDDNDGAFFEDNAGMMRLVLRCNDSGTPVDLPVDQDVWNIDKFNGKGPSRITADWTKAQIFVIDFQWLSIGRIRFGLEIDGVLYYAHKFNKANAATVPWASTPNLPLRYQMITTSASPVSVMRVICAAVISEGGQNETGIVHRKSTEGAAVTTAVENTLYAVVGVRLKSTHIGAAIKFLGASVQVQTSAELIEWVAVFNPTVAGTFTYSDQDNSAVQTALGATANTVTGGHEIGGGYVESGGGGSAKGSDDGLVSNAIMLGAAIDGTVDEVVLCVRPIGGVSAANVEGALVWRESF